MAAKGKECAQLTRQKCQQRFPYGYVRILVGMPLAEPSKYLDYQLIHIMRVLAIYYCTNNIILDNSSANGCYKPHSFVLP